MTIAHLLDHTARVWRMTVTLGQLREEIRTWAQVGVDIRVAVRRPTALLGDAGAGLAPIGERVIYCLPPGECADGAPALLPRDVVQLVAGPDAPGAFEIDGPVTSPRGHHVELRCRHFLGVLP